uniref:Uncharacterized protein n=1 Tax=Solanum tuberosum TaxID=4113 RepID=M1DNC7_SOLTU
MIGDTPSALFLSVLACLFTNFSITFGEVDRHRQPSRGSPKNFSYCQVDLVRGLACWNFRRVEDVQDIDASMDATVQPVVSVSLGIDARDDSIPSETQD